MSGKKISVTHFEFDINEKICGSEGQPNVFVGVLRRREVRGLTGGVKDSAYASAPKSHHLRKPVEANAHKKPASETHRFWRSSSMFVGKRECVHN